VPNHDHRPQRRAVTTTKSSWKTTTKWSWKTAAAAGPPSVVRATMLTLAEEDVTFSVKNRRRDAYVLTRDSVTGAAYPVTVTVTKTSTAPARSATRTLPVPATTVTEKRGVEVVTTTLARDTVTLDKETLTTLAVTATLPAEGTTTLDQETVILPVAIETTTLPAATVTDTPRARRIRLRSPARLRPTRWRRR
jgi:hypothetical protein